MFRPVRIGVIQAVASDRIEEALRIKVIVESSDKVNVIEMLPDTGADICAGEPEFLEQMNCHENNLIDTNVRIRAEGIADAIGLGIVQQRQHADGGWTTIKAGSQHSTDMDDVGAKADALSRIPIEQDARKRREQDARKRREQDARKRREQDARNRKRREEDGRNRRQSDDDARMRRGRRARRRKSITAGGGGGRRDAESANPTLTPEQQADAAISNSGAHVDPNSGANVDPDLGANIGPPKPSNPARSEHRNREDPNAHRSHPSGF